MSSEKNKQEKSELHARNKNRDRYDLKALLLAVPDLKAHIKPNKFGEDTVDFSNPQAVKLLNTGLLKHYYGVKYWEFPNENLCPPIPGRADYIHNLADLLKESNFGRMPAGDKITCLDVGTGASCIYPLLGVTEYGWHFVGSDIEQKSIDSSKNIVEENQLEAHIEFRLQKDKSAIFSNIIATDEKFDVTMCNPPFHASAEDAVAGTKRKVQNLSGKKVSTAPLNFAGVSNELLYEGGEYKFIHTMISESKRFAKSCYWFSTLVSKQSNLKGIYKALESLNAVQVKTIPMGTGNKSTRIVAWSFLSKEEQKQWKETRWNAK